MTKKQFKKGICTFKHCGRPMDEHERDVGLGVWDCPTPKRTPPDRPRGKTGEDESLFVLRAQDLSAPGVVLEWIKANIETAPHAKLRDALEIALAMTTYGTKRKTAD